MAAGPRVVLTRVPAIPGGPVPAGRTVYCAPAAGVGARSFLASFARSPLRGSLRVVQLPGREDRLREPQLDDVAEMAELVAAAIAADGAGDYALFGHSFGALVMLETARRLESSPGRAPTLLAVAACSPPHLPSPGFEGLAPEQIADALRDLGRLDLRGPLGDELAALALPALTADCRALTRYLRHPDVPAVASPILALSGALDPAIPTPKMAAWRRYTSSDFAVREYAGGHFFPLESDLSLRAVVAWQPSPRKEPP